MVMVVQVMPVTVVQVMLVDIPLCLGDSLADWLQAGGLVVGEAGYRRETARCQTSRSTLPPLLPSSYAGTGWCSSSPPGSPSSSASSTSPWTGATPLLPSSTSLQVLPSLHTKPQLGAILFPAVQPVLYLRLLLLPKVGRWQGSPATGPPCTETQHHVPTQL